MSLNDYRNSLQYIQNFYSKHQLGSDEKPVELDLKTSTNLFFTPNAAVETEHDECAAPFSFKHQHTKDRWNPVSTP